MKIRLLFVLLVALVLGSAVASMAYSYRLGPEDVVVVGVLRHEEFSGEFLIPADGIVDLPALGQVKVSGMSISELSDYITRELGKRMRQPEVSVTLKTQREQRIYVLGAVQKPGIYDYKQGWRITESLASAGGAVGDPVDCQITIMSAATGRNETVKLTDVLVAGSASNLAVEPGDVLSVETVKLLPVYVIGQVKIPGMYRLRDNGGILEALALAGGTLDTAALSKVNIIHTSGKSESVDLCKTVTEGSNDCDTKLAPGDLVIVPVSMNRIAVLGYVSSPGYFTLKENQSVTLTDAIGFARGTIPSKASMNSIMILRTNDGKQERIVCDLSRFLNNGDVKSNPIIKPGDVVFVPNKTPDWDSLTRLLSSVSLLYNVLD